MATKSFEESKNRLVQEIKTEEDFKTNQVITYSHLNLLLLFKKVSWVDYASFVEKWMIEWQTLVAKIRLVKDCEDLEELALDFIAELMDMYIKSKDNTICELEISNAKLRRQIRDKREG